MPTELKDRVRKLRKDLHLSQAELARRVGVKQQAIAQVESGKIQKPTFIVTLSKALNVSISELTGISGVDQPARTVPVVGIAQAGGSNIVRDFAGGSLGDVDAPVDATADTVAVEVRGDSMGGRLEDGDHVFFDDRREPVTDDLIGRLCVCGLEDGQVVIKRLAKGSQPGLYHLISYNAEPMFDQRLNWAARVTSIRPR